METGISAIYAETREYQEQHADSLIGTHGFRILMGPAIYRPDLLIVGQNPGGDEADRCMDEERGPPDAPDVLTRHYRWAIMLRGIFAGEGLYAVLGRSVETNRFFWRTPNSEALNAVPGLEHAEQFCFEQLNRLAEILRPKGLLIIGTGNLSRLLDLAGQKSHEAGKGVCRRLFVRLGGHSLPTLATHHITSTATNISEDGLRTISRELWGLCRDIGAA